MLCSNKTYIDLLAGLGYHARYDHRAWFECTLGLCLAWLVRTRVWQHVTWFIDRVGAVPDPHQHGGLVRRRRGAQRLRPARQTRDYRRQDAHHAPFEAKEGT